MSFECLVQWASPPSPRLAAMSAHLTSHVHRTVQSQTTSLRLIAKMDTSRQAYRRHSDWAPSAYENIRIVVLKYCPAVARQAQIPKLPPNARFSGTAGGPVAANSSKCPIHQCELHTDSTSGPALQQRSEAADCSSTTPCLRVPAALQCALTAPP